MEQNIKMKKFNACFVICLLLFLMTSIHVAAADKSYIGTTNITYSSVCPYDEIQSGTPNYGGIGITSREFITYNHQYRSRQNGNVTNASLYIGSTTNLTEFYISVWRANGTNFDRVGVSENLFSQLSVGSINILTLSSPINNVQKGDFVGYRMVWTASGAVYPVVAIDEGVTSSYYITDSNSELLNYNWKTKTSNPYALPIELYMESPQEIFIGDSIIAGHPAHYSFIESTDTTDTNITISHHFLNLSGNENQNFGIGSQTTTQISTRFLNDIINIGSGTAVIEGGVCDILGGVISQSVFLSNYETMLQHCQNADVHPIVILIMPWTNGDSTQMNTRDRWNENLTTLVGNYSGTIINTSSYIGKYRATGPAGNLWDINSSYDVDGVHFNSAGHQQIAQAIWDNTTKLYHYHRTPSAGGLYSSSYIQNITFTSKVNEISNNTWILNGVPIEYDNETKYPSYTNTSAVLGEYNLTLVSVYDSENIQTVWTWTVEMPSGIIATISDWSTTTNTNMTERGNNTLTLNLNVSNYINRWDAWDGTGTTLTDIKSGNNGTIGAGAVWDGNYIHYSGLEHTDLESQINFLDTDEWTISFVANLDTGETTGSMVMGDITDNNNFVWLHQGNYFRFRNDAGSDADFTSLTDFTGMHHYILEANGTSLTLYRNNTYIDTIAITTTFQIDAFANGYSTVNYRFDGLIGEILIFNKTLTTTERTEIYSNSHSSPGNIITPKQDASSSCVWSNLKINGTDAGTNTSLVLQINGSNDDISWSGYQTFNSTASVGDNVSITSSYQYRYAYFKIIENTSYPQETDIFTNITLFSEFEGVGITPPTNIQTTPSQTSVYIEWDAVPNADKYSVYELENGFPYVNTNPVMDGIKDAIYDYAHEFLIFSPNPVNLGDYGTIYPVRTSLGAYLLIECVDNDNKLGDDDTIYYFDLDNNGLTVDDPAWKITNNVVKKYMWGGASWQVTGVSNAVGASTNGSTHYPIHELFIPIAELGANWTNGSTVKVLVKREDSSLSPDVVTWYPYGNINDTDTSLWQEMVLNDPKSYILLDNTTNLWYNATGLTPFTIYHGAVSAWNGSVESNYTLFDVITEDIPTYTVSGTVSDTDGNPITDATVYSCNGFVVEITTTNATGYWIGYNFRENNYTICANKAGYYENNINVFVDCNLTNQDITLTAIPLSKYQKIGVMFFAIPTILSLVFQKIADVIPIIVVLVFIMLIINVIGVAIHAIRVWR